MKLIEVVHVADVFLDGPRVTGSFRQKLRWVRANHFGKPGGGTSNTLNDAGEGTDRVVEVESTFEPVFSLDSNHACHN
jgi:hypothetical protein